MTVKPNHDLSNLLDDMVYQPERRIVLVEFYGQTCALCKFIWGQVQGMLKTLPEEDQRRIDLFQIDAMANPDYAIYYGIQTIPTIILFTGGGDDIDDPIRFEKPISIPAMKEKIIEVLQWPVER